MQAVYAVTINGKWYPGVGDPTFWGWLITGGYAVGTLLCIRAAGFGCAECNGANRRFWSLAIVTLIFLGFNKQLDLQTLLWLVGRIVAKSQGWYEERKAVQYALVLCIAVFGVVSIWGLSQVVRPLRGCHIVALLGMVVLLCFVLLRIVSIHRVDYILATEIAGIAVKNVVESGGILLVCTGATTACLNRNTDIALPHSRKSDSETRNPIQGR